MSRATRASSRCAKGHANNANRGRRKRGLETNVTKSVYFQNKTAILSPSGEREKLIATELVTNENNDGEIKTIHNSQKICSPVIKSITYIYYQNSDTINLNNLGPHLLENGQVPICGQEKKEIISDVEQFKVDETTVAVPVHKASTPHKIKMQLVDAGATNPDKSNQSVMQLQCSPLKVVMKPPAARGRKKGISSKPVNQRPSTKPSTIGTNHSITEYFPVRRSVRKSKKVVLEEKQRDLENKVLSQIEEGLEIRYFPGKGRGVITTREFAKGEFVVEYIGELINLVEAKEREKRYAQDQNAGCYMYYFQHRNQQYCVDATAESNKLGRLVNHSRNGNLVTRIVEVCSMPHLVLTAKEDISIGEEITYDYGDRSRESIRHHPWLAL
ncbi:histone-lysine N-methyltransferase pr-set7 [Pseudomyrmex gracilis]|uniref:histone-lysine N-methyltransferase pr-set7 n=1 Tax=Pseudomyrmex gracilis TaxID=219809 RepID=UPI000995228B|nr:histone-lysine N-methyltransferase pr-set7 [Pseudomyrmex gracilis]